MGHDDVVLRRAAVLAHTGHGPVLLTDASVVVRSGAIVYVGAGDPPPGTADGITDVRDLPGRIVLPGLINLHAHATTGAHHHLVDGAGEPELDGATYLTTKAPRPGTAAPDADPVTAAEMTVWELLRHGSTTVLEAGGSPAGVTALAEVAERVGLRAMAGPAMSSGKWCSDGHGSLEWESDPDDPSSTIAAASTVLDALTDGRFVSGAVAVAQADTASDDLLRAANELALRRGLPLTLHAAQNRRELRITREWHGSSPIRRLGRLGVLRPGVVLAHAVFLDHHPAVEADHPSELELLAVSGAAVAHCPVHLARRGDALVDLATYRELGVPVGIGTDTHPRDLVREVGAADLIARVVAGPAAGSVRAAIESVTTVGAAALGRTDLGRLEVGGPADLVVVDLRRLGLVRDPVAAVVEQCTGTDVEHVIVDGRSVVTDGVVAGIDIVAARQRSADAAALLWNGAADWHRHGLDAEQLAPSPFPIHTTPEVAAP